MTRLQINLIGLYNMRKLLYCHVVSLLGECIFKEKLPLFKNIFQKIAFMNLPSNEKATFIVITMDT
jgi:hypothetical protein